MDVRMPDGTVIQGVPDNISQEELLKRYRQFADLPNPSERDKELNSASSRLMRGWRDGVDGLAQVLSRAAEVAPVPFAQPGNPTRIMDIAKGVSNVLGLPDPTSKAVDAEIAAREAEYQAARKAAGKGDEWDGMRFLGNLTSPSNVLLGRAAAAMGPATSGVKDLAVAGVKAGALGSFFVPANVKNPDEFLIEKAKQAGVGAVAGGIAGPVIGKIVDYAAPRVLSAWQSARGSEQSRTAALNQAIDRVLGDLEAGLRDVPNEVREQIRAQIRTAVQGRSVDPAAAARRADFEGLGMQGLLGQYTRDPRQYAVERNIRSSSDEITTLLQEQNRKLRELVGGYGNQAKSPYAAGEEIIGALKQADSKASSGVTQAYQQARTSSGKEWELPLQGLAQDYAQVLRDFGDRIPAGVRNNLDDLGLLTGRQNKLYTVEEAERILQLINQSGSKTDNATNSALARLRDAVKRSVTEAIDDGGVFEGARKLASQRFKLLEKTPALEAAIKDVEPDKFVSQFVINGNVRQVRSMADVLKKESPDAFEQARQQIGSYLERAAFGDDVAMDKAFSAQNFAKKLREIGNEKLSTFYTPQEIQALHQIARVAQYINSPPAASAVNYSNNSAWALPLLEKMPGVGGLTTMLRGMLGSARQGLQARKALTANLPPPPRPQVSPELERYLMSAPPAVLGLLSGAVVAP